MGYIDGGKGHRSLIHLSIYAVLAVHSEPATGHVPASDWPLRDCDYRVADYGDDVINVRSLAVNISNRVRLVIDCRLPCRTRRLMFATDVRVHVAAPL